ncbi:winged helix-turn-helix transcriptional regulator [Psychromonas ossibalaenae]|uniref:winged helix-turn-helix transcriptional regulator n=1 Tax=Psychromonas ossibalaenae TaxID=444922 RepID=UPI00037920C0|nr:helix-turn-helix domain-containing protein [Psychromonas ossibalaenae]
MTLPVPGEPVRGSKTGKPIMALFDLLGRTWCMGIIWQLSLSNATFRQLQARCEDISPTLLNKRLHELAQLGLVKKTETGYGLTEQASALALLIKPMGPWARSWAENLPQQLKSKEKNDA